MPIIGIYLENHVSQGSCRHGNGNGSKWGLWERQRREEGLHGGPCCEDEEATGFGFSDHVESGQRRPEKSDSCFESWSVFDAGFLVVSRGALV